MTLVQKNRLLGLSTPLGEDELVLTAFRGYEEISRSFSFQLEMISDNNSITAADIVGKNVTFSILLADESPRLFNGFVSAVLRVPSFITTLGMLVMARGLAREITSGNTIGGLPDAWGEFWATEILGLRMPIWVAVAVGVVFHIVLRYTRFGLHIYAVGGNAEAARRSGINVTRVRLAVFLTGGLAVSLAGFTLLGRVDSGQPNAAQLTELFAVAAVVLGGTNLFGGRGSILRTVAGVILIGEIRNSLNLLGVSSNMQDVWLGLIFMLAMTSSLIREHVVRWTSRFPSKSESQASDTDPPTDPDPVISNELTL